MTVFWLHNRDFPDNRLHCVARLRYDYGLRKYKDGNFGSNLAAVASFVSNGNVDYSLALPCALCGVLGNYLGSGLALKKGARIVRPMMIIVILILFSKVMFDVMTS